MHALLAVSELELRERWLRVLSARGHRVELVSPALEGGDQTAELALLALPEVELLRACRAFRARCPGGRLLVLPSPGTPLLPLVEAGADDLLIHGTEEELHAHLALAQRRRPADGEPEVIRRLLESWAGTLAAIPDFVMVVDRAGAIRFINRTRPGLLPGEVLGRTIFEFIPEEAHPRARQAIDCCYTLSKADSYEVTTPEDGRSYLSRLYPVLQQGRTAAVVIVATEVSEQRRMEEHALAAEGLAATGSLATCVAHQINNPLTYVIANLSFVAAGLAEASARDPGLRPLERAIADVREGVDRVRTIAADLLLLSRGEAQPSEPVDVRRVLDAVLNVTSNEIRHRARLEKSYREVALVWAPEALLGQIFLSLLLMAARTIPEGCAETERIRVVVQMAGERVQVEIEGTRLAPSQEWLDGLFTGASPWLVPPEVHGGAALGLAVSGTLVARLGGRISARATGRDGLAVTVELPAHSATRAAQRAELGQEPQAAQARARILVVDDEPVIASTLQRALAHHDVYVLTSGADAVELCKSEIFDLILCDLMMPGVNGMQLYESLAGMPGAQHERVVFMTGGAFTQTSRRFLAGVQNALLEKPFEVQEIQRLLDDILARRRVPG